MDVNLLGAQGTVGLAQPLLGWAWAFVSTVLDVYVIACRLYYTCKYAIHRLSLASAA